MYEYGQERAAFHNKETRYQHGVDNAVIGFSRTVGDATANAFQIAGKARQAKAAAERSYATSQRVDEGGGARNAGRNQYLALLDKHREAEYAVDQAWGVGMDRAEIGARRQLSNKFNKLEEALGIPKSPPLMEPIPGKDRFGQIMQGVQMATQIAKIGAAPFTGGASLGIPGIGKGAGQWNPFGPDTPAPGSEGGSGGGGLFSSLMGAGGWQPPAGMFNPRPAPKPQTSWHSFLRF